jgi:hypothetical protein
MAIRAKMVCDSVLTDRQGGRLVKFEAVLNNCEENKSFSKWTPSAQISMFVTNPQCDFEPGKEYYVDFCKVIAPRSNKGLESFAAFVDAGNDPSNTDVMTQNGWLRKDAGLDL